MIIFNQTKQKNLITNVVVAKTFFKRLKGLLGKKILKDQEGLLITQCHSVHMFFMQFPIDVCFLDKQWRVVGMEHSIKPFFISRIFWNAEYALETQSGLLKTQNVSIGDVLILKES